MLVSTVAAQALRAGERASIFPRLAYPTIDAIFLKYIKSVTTVRQALVGKSVAYRAWWKIVDGAKVDSQGCGRHHGYWEKDGELHDAGSKLWCK